MAKELNKHGCIVGSQQYFAQLHSRGLLSRIISPESSIEYEHIFGRTVDKANAAVKVILEDLAAAGTALRFMETENINRAVTAVMQLQKLCVSMQQRLGFVTDCLEYLSLRHRDTRLKSRASMRDLERGYDILHGSGSYDLPESREKLFDMLLGGFFSDTAYGEADVARFVYDLDGGNGREALKDLELYIRYRENPRRFDGRWGAPIGSRRYLERLEEEVFESRLYSSELSKGEYTYGESFEADLRSLADNIIDDIRQSPYDEYIVFDNRARVMKAAAGLERFAGNLRASEVEGYLNQYRRLEDFDNRVVEFDTRGTTKARMAWENGKNVMYIEADVWFMKGPLNETPDDVRLGKEDDAPEQIYYGDPKVAGHEWSMWSKDKFENRVAKAIENFKLWAGTYTVFRGQQLEVEVTINRKSTPFGASKVIITDIGGGIRSFALGQSLLVKSPHPNPMIPLDDGPYEYETLYGFRRLFDWDSESSKLMGLLGDITAGNTPVHEFGHWLGLQDAYDIPNSWVPIESMRYPLTGVPFGVYPDFDGEASIMSDKKGRFVTKNDMEMVVLAFQTGRRQNYQIQFPWEEISTAMGR